jgi:hypothetical protein
MTINTLVLGWLAISTVAAGDRITVQVQNLAPESLAAVRGAEPEVSWIFSKSGVEVEFVHCPPPEMAKPGEQICTEPDDPRFFVLVIRRDDAPGVACEMSLGFALTGSGKRNHAAILYRRVLETVKENEGAADEKSLLASVMAHELGHLLLGSTKHGSTIMRRGWSRSEFALMAQRRLLFTSEQGEELHAGLQRRVVQSERQLAKR